MPSTLSVSLHKHETEAQTGEVVESGAGRVSAWNKREHGVRISRRGLLGQHQMRYLHVRGHLRRVGPTCRGILGAPRLALLPPPRTFGQPPGVTTRPAPARPRLPRVRSVVRPVVFWAQVGHGAVRVGRAPQLCRVQELGEGGSLPAAVARLPAGLRRPRGALLPPRPSRRRPQPGPPRRLPQRLAV